VLSCGVLVLDVFSGGTDMGKPTIASNDDLRKHKVQLERNLINYGYYEGFRRTCQEFDIPKPVCQKLEAMLFKHMIQKVQEGLREIPKLQASLNRMEGICKMGSVPANLSGNGPTIPLWADMGTTMQAIDGWAISLLETSISLLMVVQNPETGAHRVKSLQESFSNLWIERAKKRGALGNYPDLFDMTYLPTKNL
jgi:hypothetical protein